MRPEEALTMKQWVDDLSLPAGAVVLNVGSSTGEFRTITQPHIDALLFKPLREAGLRVIHCDMKTAKGVDEVGDLLDADFRDRLKSYHADLMICSNLLEHLVDPYSFAEACGELVRPGGHGFITVPLSYPYHPDPIDTLLRPTPQQLSAILPGWESERGEVLKSGSYITDLRASGRPWSILFSHVARVLLPFYRPRHWRPLAHRLFWLWRPYSVSMVLLRKPASP